MGAGKSRAARARSAGSTPTRSSKSPPAKRSRRSSRTKARLPSGRSRRRRSSRRSAAARSCRPRVREALRDSLTIWLDVDVDTCWERVKNSKRPLARDETEFRRLYEERRKLYAEVADVVAKDVHDVVLAAAGVVVERGALARLAELVPGDGPVALVSDPHVAGIHGATAQLALGPRLAETHELPSGEEAKTLAAVSTGSGRNCASTAAARSSRSEAAARPTPPASPPRRTSAASRGFPCRRASSRRSTRRSAARRRSTSRRARTSSAPSTGPSRTVIDPALLETLPEAQRLEGMAEVVKTGLLAGESFWELPDDELVRRCAAYKAAVCLRDPEDKGERKMLNLGHTFAHALEAAAGTRGHARPRSRPRPARPRCVSPGRDTPSSTSCSSPSRCASIATARGRRSCATRRARSSSSSSPARTSSSRPRTCAANSIG